MKYLARGSVFFGIFALLMTLFYFQPQVEAALVIASDAQNNNQVNIQKFIQTNIQSENQFTEELYTPNNLTVSADDPEANSENSNSILADAKSFRATAYCLKGKTASGSRVRRGIVAADPRVLPLGTRIQLDAGSYSGTYTVADTGGSVRGRILDIWVPSCAEAKRFGRKKVLVTVLNKKKRKRR
ncbi:MAG: 3D domain-containing protein [Pyrinomonadaceae bacterium]